MTYKRLKRQTDLSFYRKRDNSVKTGVSQFWIEIRRCSTNEITTYTASGRGIGVPGRSLSYTFQSYADLKDDLDNLGISLSWIADRQLRGGLHAAVECDERTLCLLGIWDPVAA
ncbi:hypothetical protein SAMN05444167_0991 [Terriglobus roseus]|uniref:Uncharacterized protein n=1 Tax=Terriglobus roseus TaxID=392734 RepID=A0A1G7HAJ7_9BACT|nr:hypothetical protein SAMN05444167_0991 [Terriglobus roseus]